jgi:cytochrome c
MRKHDAGGSTVRVTTKMKAVRSSAALMAAVAVTCLTGAAARADDGDPVKGKAAFVRQCAICHTAEKDGYNHMGPNLFGIVGKKAGAVPGFAYTNAFKNRANWEWTEDAIGGWMMFPSTMVPGTAMGAFQGIAEKDRDDLVAYLATLK